MTEVRLLWDDGTECDYSGYRRLHGPTDTREASWGGTVEVYEFPEMVSDRQGWRRVIAFCRIDDKTFPLAPQIRMSTGITPVAHLPLTNRRSRP